MLEQDSEQACSADACVQAPGAALSSVAQRYSSIIGGLTVAKRLAAKLLPDGARTVRMWRQFLPIYVRCKWTAWRYQEAKGCPAQVCAGTSPDICKISSLTDSRDCSATHETGSTTQERAGRARCTMVPAYRHASWLTWLPWSSQSWSSHGC